MESSFLFCSLKGLCCSDAQNIVVTSSLEMPLFACIILPSCHEENASKTAYLIEWENNFTVLLRSCTNDNSCTTNTGYNTDLHRGLYQV